MAQPSLSVVKSEPLSVASSEPLPGATGAAPLSVEPDAGRQAGVQDTGGREAGGGVGQVVKDFLGELESLKLHKLPGHLATAVTNPSETVAAAAGGRQDYLRQEALSAFQEGDYATGVRKFTNWLIPLFGPQLDAAGDAFAEGDVARGAGKTADVALQAIVPAAVSKVRSVPLSPGLARLNPTEEAAVAFGREQGVPIDAATATGSPFVSRAQGMASANPGGAGIAERFRRGQSERLAQVGDEQAARAYPTRAVTQEQAGQGARDAVRGQAVQYDTAADAAYTRLRQLEARATPETVRVTQTGRTRGGGEIPITTPQEMRLAVDVKPTKEALKLIYDQLLRESELVPLQGDRARALTALDRLMNGPDAAPLSVVDGALGDLKRMARVKDSVQRTEGQGIAAEAVKQLEQVVTQTARNAGPDVFRALMDGRAATVNKYKAIEVLDRLREEPVQVFRQLTANKDAGVALLRDVKKYAPDELPKVGRAWLDDLMERATAEGGFSRADSLWADWQRMGRETKLMLFRDPNYISSLDSFFLLAKRIGHQPNPSGTALSLNATKLASAPFNYALSKLMYSGKGIALLMRGAKIPAGAKASTAAWLSEVTKAAGEVRGMRVPTAAEDRQASGESEPRR